MHTQQVPTSQSIPEIPDRLAHALATLEAPSGLVEFVRVYGQERGEFEWECHTQRAKEEQARKAAEAVVIMGKAIAEQNGWPWADVVAQTRRDHPGLFSMEGV